MNIRPAREDEAAVLQSLNEEVFIDNYKYDPDLKADWAQSEKGRDYFTKILSNPEAICLIAEEGGITVGYIAAAPKEFGYRNSKYLEIENMGVIPDFRSKGVGRELVGKCVEIAKQKGYQKVYVNSYSENVRAINFYEKSGFKKIDVSLEKDI